VRTSFVSSLIFLINAIQIVGVLSSGFPQIHIVLCAIDLSSSCSLLFSSIYWLPLVESRSRFLSCFSTLHELVNLQVGATCTILSSTPYLP
jgi:hypothetical protein